LTPSPCEPRNSVIPLKSISAITQAEQPEAQESPEAGEPAAVEVEASEAIDINLPITKESNEMEITQEILDQLLTKAVGDAVKAVQASAPAPDTAGRVTVSLDEADRPFTSVAEQARAVKAATVSGGRIMDPRLTRLDAMKAASGANEFVETEGGYAIDPTVASEILKPIHDSGPFSNLVTRLPVGANSNYGWSNGIDETSRANGSRWGGVRGYWLAEAGSLTASKPRFRRINWELKKIGVLMYATDELLADQSQFNAIAMQSAAEELAFIVNDDIFEGDGLGKPLGILQSGALIEAGRDTASTIVHADILAMWTRMLPTSRAKSAWFINAVAEGQLDSLYHTTSVLSPYVGYRPDGVRTLFGRPVIVNEFGEALNSKGDILLADMSEYLFWEKDGVQSASSIHLAFLTDEMAFRWIYRCDGQTSASVPLTTFKGSSTQSAFVCLEAAT
jgi:HK97 family phage major capsid protein